MKKNEANWRTMKMKKFGFSTISMILFRKCVSFPKKINNQFWRGHRFSAEKWQFACDVEQNTYFTDESWRNNFRWGQHF